MENIRNNNPMSSEAGVSSSSINPMQNEFDFEEKQQQPLLPPLPVNNDYENYFWSNSTLRSFDEQQQLELAQPSFSFDPSYSSMSILTPRYDHFAQQDNQLQPFSDLWS